MSRSALVAVLVLGSFLGVYCQQQQQLPGVGDCKNLTGSVIRVREWTRRPDAQLSAVQIVGAFNSSLATTLQQTPGFQELSGAPVNETDLVLFSIFDSNITSQQADQQVVQFVQQNSSLSSFLSLTSNLNGTIAFNAVANISCPDMINNTDRFLVIQLWALPASGSNVTGGETDVTSIVQQLRTGLIPNITRMLDGFREVLLAPVQAEGPSQAQSHVLLMQVYDSRQQAENGLSTANQFVQSNSQLMNSLTPEEAAVAQISFDVLGSSLTSGSMA